MLYLLYLIANKFYLTSQNTIMKNKKLKNIKTKQFGKPNQFDVNGSYTGTSSLIADLKPVQDADDL